MEDLTVDKNRKNHKLGFKENYLKTSLLVYL